MFRVVIKFRQYYVSKHNYDELDDCFPAWIEDDESSCILKESSH
jgi:hypothetical protein